MNEPLLPKAITAWARAYFYADVTFFAIPANKTFIAGQPVTNVAQVITVSCLFQYDLILLCDKTVYLYPFLMS